MIDGGKVYYEGYWVKVSKEVVVGVFIWLCQGMDEKEVVVICFSDCRGNVILVVIFYDEIVVSLEKCRLMVE